MFGNDWDNVLKDIYNTEYFNSIKDKIRYEYNHKVMCENQPYTNQIYYI